ncbi:MAG TPA: Gfo/Idh/MocA family oxidoreductase [Tepidisphaeraceae bacterium]|nr:Gfo/Idh/MocA family oxidoreductase [Tepidisphaeraceae bacterium]
MSKLKLGVLGLGEGRSIISAAMNSDLWELAQLCDLNETLCQQRCDEFKFPRYTTSLDEMLTDRSIDAIGIYTPDPLHAEHIISCLRAGKHVICTKPLIDNLADAPRVIEAQREAGKCVFVGQSTRFFESMQRQRADYDAGKHGEVYSVEAYYNADNRWFLQRGWARTGGLKWLYGGLSHPVDLVRWYLPDITEVMGYGMLTTNGQELGLTHPDSMHFIATSRGGKIARISGHYSGPYGNSDRDSGMSCVLRGTLGTSQADYSDLRYSTHFAGQGHVQYRMDHRSSYYFRFGGKSHHAGEYQNYIEHFARCIIDGSTPKPDISEGIVTVAVMAAMERSLETAKPVKIRTILDEHGLSDFAAN